ncbi:MAG TPA: limonene-1,2-epoxide hydrolase family protein [Solirubrobacterales bacterium]|nr:limonene-1,2-epoxide hydrolase family protein [Solirubrobacterales bacterium]
MSEPTQVAEQFLSRLAAGEIDAAADLLAVDVEYSNVSLPTVRGRERVRRLFHLTLGRPGAGFEVYNHAISASAGSVLTERTDVMTFGRLRIQFWVCGRFDVENGEIVLWRDRFDWMNYTVATLRGLLGVLVPAARAKPPRSH